MSKSSPIFGHLREMIGSVGMVFGRSSDDFKKSSENLLNILKIRVVLVLITVSYNDDFSVSETTKLGKKIPISPNRRS